MTSLDEVKKYYGQTITSQDDLKTTACCTAEKPPQHILDALNNLHPKIHDTYYGCGLIAPDELEDLRILDLGSGTGHDVYLLAQLTGPKGYVLGVDMTDEQLEIAREYEKFHQEKFGYSERNTEFFKGYIENLDMIDTDSIDLVVSNCVVNLSNNKEAVLNEIYRVLKPGGEFYFSDVYSSRRIPKKLQEDSVLWGECLSGALYWNDFLHLAQKVGFNDPRLVKDKQIAPKNAELEATLGDIKFYSVTYRLFKIEDLEYDCEDYGQIVTYNGTITNHSEEWQLDNHHTFRTNEKMRVCMNTYLILGRSRFEKHFTFESPEPLTHLGIFPDCGKGIPFESSGSVSKCC